MDNKIKYLKYKNKYLELKSRYNMIGSGRYELLPHNLLQYVSSNETPEERQIRERKRPHDGPYNVFDSIEELTDYYFNDSSPKKRPLFQLFVKLFERIFIPDYRIQIINSRGNGLCAYNSLYMYLQLTGKQDIIKIITQDDTLNFDKFRENLRQMAINTLDESIKEFMVPLIDDTNAPELQPIFNAFVSITGINILVIDVNTDTLINQFFIFEHTSPIDYIVLLRKGSHVMLIHTYTNDIYIRQQIYQNIR